MTRRQFDAFVSQTGYQTDAEKRGWGTYMNRGVSQIPGRNWRNPGYEVGPDHPVACVTWNDAAKFCEWLSAKTGRHFRLPTEAEREYTCRAGTATRYFWGDDDKNGGNGFCNVSDQTLKDYIKKNPPVPGLNSDGRVSWSDGYVFAAPVGCFRPNAWGLFDMSGNLWEWCSDWFEKDYQNAQRVDPQGPGAGSGRVIRGGCFDETPRAFRSAKRLGFAPENADFGVGFRVCCDGDTSAQIAPAKTSVFSPGTDSHAEKLKTLKRAFEQGLLSKEQYDAKVKDILDGI